MKIRDIKKQMRKRFLVTVVVLVTILFGMILLLRLIGKSLMKENVPVLIDKIETTEVSDWKIDSEIIMKGMIYRKIIDTKPIYVLFAENNLKYIIDNSETVWLDKNLGKDITLKGKIEKFMGSVPYVTVIK